MTNKKISELGANGTLGGTEYVDGVKTGATVTHPSWPSSNNFLNIGNDVSGYMNGYLNDLRISDIAVYTANFTPPTSPF